MVKFGMPMPVFKLFLLVFMGFLAFGDPSEGCLNEKQKKTLEKVIINLEKKFQGVLIEEMTAHAENLEADPLKENAKKLYFELRNKRAELERANSDFCKAQNKI